MAFIRVVFRVAVFVGEKYRTQAASLVDEFRRKNSTLLDQLSVFISLFINHAEIWWVVGIAVSSIFAFVPLPKFASKAVVIVAAFSLMIYLTHVPARNLFEMLWGSSAIANVTSVVLQILLGIALGKLMRPALDRLGINSVAEKKISF